ncbi:MAG: DNA ligase D [Bosea sp. (in: a-proteobacteria)]|uniref:DNA ligase D n=1 Tax=Bosea sp. (in: a-proteobacteria) TaxID=1871050 RepID=UPI002732D64C|nr:DNA ligase D [Bosea sp. (in: a-proteobacteria)]MDP3255121.1 DNA ligase D [Bosea sp. (in: a-proteobacteria)]MDP3319535.1 DNA ligase D [Bosea sp. (in: a-proteobacteria)]
MAGLDVYRAKRDFTRTSEPQGKAAPSRAAKARARQAHGGVFVVHKHAARRLHYDLRLEHDGVLWSWAVTRGPSLDPDEKRLAVHVEDHPLDYGSFEGTIPEGQYGAGSVIVWDEGRWVPEGDPDFGLRKGHLSFMLEGHKLAGQWHLVRLKPRRGEKRDNWLLIKVDDAAARPDEDILETAPNSVASGLSIDDIAEGKAPEPRVWGKTKRPGTNDVSEAGRQPAARSAANTTRAAKSKAVRKAAPKTTSKPQPHDALPDFVPPCLATLQEKPPAGERWLHEVKFDGYRLQARIDNGAVRLLTRSGLDWTDRFGATLSEALAGLPCETALIDGEVVALGESGVSSFGALQQALSDGTTGALTFFAFDCLHLDGQDLRADPLIARKGRLEDLLRGADEAGPLRYSEHFIEPGQTMLRHACRMGLEGVISKRADAPYRSGRGRDWVKSKCTLRQEFVIAGYVPSEGSGRELGSILAAYHEDEALKPAGRVGTGFTRASAAALKQRLDTLRSEASPFEGAAGREKGVVWVKPELVAEVEFGAWTGSKTLRHASFLGLREDKPAQEVVAEQPAEVSAGEAPASKATTRSRSGPAKTKRKPAKAAGASAAPKATTSVRLSSPDKPLWPDIGFTKQGLLDYYATIWPVMAPHVIERPLSLVRAPNGIAGHSFFQKHAMPGMHEAVHRVKDKDGEELLVIRDFDGLAALVQLGTVEIHLWGATIEAVETPDQIIFDLDPDPGVPLERVREAALTVRDRLREIGFESLLKTSGGKGYHVVMPLRAGAGWDRVKGFARDFAQALAGSEPARFTATLSKKARKGKIFVDYLRNGRGSTAIAPYSTRARPGAPVAMPIAWEDLKTTAPDAFDAATLLEEGPPADHWNGFFDAARPLTGKG